MKGEDILIGRNVKMYFLNSKLSLFMIDTGVQRTDRVAWKRHKATYLQSSMLCILL